MKQRMQATNLKESALPPGVTVRLMLVRHGEPEDAARGRCYGKLDVGLSDLGREHVRQTARWLERIPFIAIYASPRRRARESAEIIANQLLRDVYVEDRLCEIDFGEFEGMTYDEVAEHYPEEYLAWMNRPTEVIFPGGESFEQMRERVTCAAAQVRASYRGQTVILVTHGGVYRIILAEALRMESRDIFRLDQAYAAVSMIDYYDETPVIRLVNYRSV
jgi:alpha-ribazole phosphatase